MPIYEYECLDCNTIMQCLVIKKSDQDTISCTKCGSGKLKKLISRVAYHVSESDRLASFEPASPKSESFYRDSRNIGLHAKKRAQQMGVDLGSSFNEKLEKLRTDPGSVLKEND